MAGDRAHGGGTHAEESEVDAGICGDTGVLVFWDPHSKCVLDVCVFNTDVYSYEGIYPHKTLSQHEWCIKGKYIEYFLEQQRHFTLIVFSVVGVIREEANMETKQLAPSLLTK